MNIYAKLKTELKAMHAKYAGIDNVDEHGSTALSRTVANNDYDLVKKLLENGASANPVEKSASPLLTARHHSTPEMIDLLVEHGAEVISIPEMFRVGDFMNERIDNIRHLVKKHGLDVNVETDGRTPLMQIAGWGSTEYTKALVELGAEVNAHVKNGRDGNDHGSCIGNPITRHGRDERERTPLMYAAIYAGYGARVGSETLKVLLDGGAEVDARDAEGRTALMLAANDALGGSSDDIKKLEILLDAGADINAKDNCGMSVLDYARERFDDSRVVRFLEEKGAEGNPEIVAKKQAVVEGLRRVEAGKAEEGAAMIIAENEKLGL